MTWQVYNAVSGSLKHQFNYHTSEVYIVTTNPVFKDVIMTAGGDGRVALWNVSSGERLFGNKQKHEAIT